MKCLFCTTELPVDSNISEITCPKCGSDFHVVEMQLKTSEEYYGEETNSSMDNKERS